MNKLCKYVLNTKNILHSKTHLDITKRFSTYYSNIVPHNKEELTEL